MNLTQSSSILELVRKVIDIDMDEILEKVYPGRSDLDIIELTQMSLSESVYLKYRILINFHLNFQNVKIP
jgi:hypothetical protein